MYLWTKVIFVLVGIVALTTVNIKVPVFPTIESQGAFSFRAFDFLKFIKRPTKRPVQPATPTPSPSFKDAVPLEKTMISPTPGKPKPVFSHSPTLNLNSQKEKGAGNKTTEILPDTSRNNSQTQDKSSDLANKFNSVEREIGVLYGAKNIISTNHYKKLAENLNDLENKNYRISDIKKLREMLAVLNPDEQVNPQPVATTSSKPSEICSSTRPMLVSDITDFSKIQKITAPGTQSIEGPKGHSFIWTNSQRVPVYAPITAILESGAYSKDNENSPAQYNLTFNIQGYCYKFRFDHIDEPINAIRTVLPSTSKVADSRGTFLTQVIEFQTGDLIGYTKGNLQSGNWDFGLYNMSKEGPLAQYGGTGIHRNGVCWPDYYSSDKYKKLLEGPKLVCGQPSPESYPAPTSLTSTNKGPVLKNLGVSFESWNRNTNRAGAFLFKSSENKLFLEYGAEVPSSEGGTKILPTFEYRTSPDADVLSAIDGVVTKVDYQSNTQDYEILIQPEENSQWTLGQDHINNPRVTKGNRVKAGDILGKVGSFGEGLGRTEIMLWKSSSTRPETHCPLKYFDPQLLSQYKQKIQQHMKDWEEFKGNSNIYNENNHILPGCIYETLLD